MTLVVINEITLPASSAVEAGAELERRFEANVPMMRSVDGCESVEVLRPADGAVTYIILSHWRDRDAYEAWKRSDVFRRQHRHAEGEKPTHKVVSTDSRIRTFEVAISG